MRWSCLIFFYSFSTTGEWQEILWNTFSCVILIAQLWYVTSKVWTAFTEYLFVCLCEGPLGSSKASMFGRLPVVLVVRNEVIYSSSDTLRFHFRLSLTDASKFVPVNFDIILTMSWISSSCHDSFPFISLWDTWDLSQCAVYLWTFSLCDSSTSPCLSVFPICWISFYVNHSLENFYSCWNWIGSACPQRGCVGHLLTFCECHQPCTVPTTTLPCSISISAIKRIDFFQLHHYYPSMSTINIENCYNQVFCIAQQSAFGLP